MGKLQPNKALHRLDPDVAEVFPNDKTVNEALRGLLKIMEATRLVKVSSEHS